MNPRLRALIERKQKAKDAAKALTDAATREENRNLTEDEAKAFDGHMADIVRIDADIKREEALIAAERTAPAIAAGDGARVIERAEEDPRRGFRTYGEFCLAVRRASSPGGVVDPRLLPIGAAAPATYGNESSGADGGFLVPAEYAREVWTLSLSVDNLLPLTDDYPVTGNSLTFPSDETTPWGTNGIRAYWESEAGTATGTKPKLEGPANLRLSKLMALVPVTDELLADASALERYITRKSAESIRWKTNLALFEGSGVGQPLGFRPHAVSVSVAKEAAQVADTIVAENVAKMFARQINPANAVWMINNDAYPQLMLLNKANQMLWMPDFRVGPGGALMGRPVMLSQLCETVGDQGDIVFVDWKYYRTITKAGAGIETATSMHLYFDAGLTAFRATFRVDGQPALKAAVSPANGANTLSPFVQLDVRA